jgi:hypothetical protein
MTGRFRRQDRAPGQAVEALNICNSGSFCGWSCVDPLIIIIHQQQRVLGRGAQYYGLESVAAMESKLAQFPRGTQFVLYAPGGQSARTAAEIHRFATEKGFVVTVQ